MATKDKTCRRGGRLNRLFAGVVCLLRPRFHGRAGTLMKQLRCRWLNDRLRLLLKVRSMHGRARKVREK